VVDDLVEPDALHLLRLAPKAWLKSDRQTKFENVPTVFGPVTVRFDLQDGGSTLAVEYQDKFHHSPRQVHLHLPPLPGITRVIVNGKTIERQAGDVVDLPQP